VKKVQPTSSALKCGEMEISQVLLRQHVRGTLEVGARWQSSLSSNYKAGGFSKPTMPTTTKPIARTS